ncbi:MAG: hypothetical protein PHO79_08475 [Desulfoplanes sp.]|nr:hypothetical protein [Desulfoplanes sp.]
MPKKYQELQPKQLTTHLNPRKIPADSATTTISINPFQPRAHDALELGLHVQ